MQEFFERFDRLAGIDGQVGIRVWLERAAFAFLVLMALSAPHSIAATQTAWLLGMTVWVARLVIKPRPKFRFGLLDVAIWGLFVWTIVSAVFSYDQPTSLDKLRSASVFLIFYFALYNLRNLRAVYLVTFILIGSCMINVIWVPIERLTGRGVEIHQVASDGPLAKASLQNGDTLLFANSKRLRTPEDLFAEIESNESADVKFYRPEVEPIVKVSRANLLPGSSATERLGIGNWTKNHKWRSKGFYGHYVTYAEVLQLIGSLVFGLFIAGFAYWNVGRESGASAKNKQEGPRGIANVKKSHLSTIGAGFVLICLALLLTATRAPQLGLMLSAGAIVLFGLGRRWFLIAVLICVPIAAGGLYFLQQSREIGFIDRTDESTRYRFVMIKDGMRIWTESPRNFIFGVGVDSIKKHWREWGMFEGGNLPMGHFHSTPVQLLVERGLPALIFWLLMMGAFLFKLWRGLDSLGSKDWPARGILLGALGGTIGFLASSIVHYNFGDQEVVMVFYLIMALSMAITGRQRFNDAATA